MRIRELRIKAGLTQSRLAQLLGQTQQAVARWEAGEAMPRSDKLQQLAEILDCSIDDLYRKEA